MARKLVSLRDRILSQKLEADRHHLRLRPDPHRGPGYGGEPADLQGLQVRTGALRGLVDDLKKLADEIDPPKGK